LPCSDPHVQKDGQQNLHYQHRPMSGIMDTPSILNFPSEVTRLTVSFLSGSDALNLAATCKTLYSKVSVHVLLDSHILFTRKVWSGDSRSGHKDIPFLHIRCLSQHVLSIMLTFKWRDQGRGRSKGELWVISRKKDISPDPFQRFYGGQVVWESGLAPTGLALNEMIPCRVTFPTSTDEIYQLWFRVGTGGGHELHLQNGRLHMLISDDDQKNLLASYKSREMVDVIAEKLQTEFGPLNVEGLHELIGTMGVDAVSEDD